MDDKYLNFAKSQLARKDEIQTVKTFKELFGGDEEKPEFDRVVLFSAGWNDQPDHIYHDEIFVNEDEANKFCEDKVLYVIPLFMRRYQAVQALERKVKITEIKAADDERLCG